MGQSADPDISSIHADREIGVGVGWRYTTGRSGVHACSPVIATRSAVDDIRAAAATSYGAWVDHLSTYHAAVWSWLQADATAVAIYQTGRGISTTQAQVLAHRHALDAMEG